MVDLPEPLEPTTATLWPGSTLMLTPLSTRRSSWYPNLTSSSSTRSPHVPPGSAPEAVLLLPLLVWPEPPLLAPLVAPTPLPLPLLVLAWLPLLLTWPLPLPELLLALALTLAATALPACSVMHASTSVSGSTTLPSFRLLSVRRTCIASTGAGRRAQACERVPCDRRLFLQQGTLKCSSTTRHNHAWREQQARHHHHYH